MQEGCSPELHVDFKLFLIKNNDNETNESKGCLGRYSVMLTKFFPVAIHAREKIKMQISLRPFSQKRKVMQVLQVLTQLLQMEW